MTSSRTHLVLLPSYNSGPRLDAVVAEALERWRPVLVVIDGSDDGSERPVLARAGREPGLHVLVRPRNEGKGAAVLAGAAWAQAQGFTHALTMDADGQHVAACLPEFMAVSQRQPGALVLGRPIFPANVPRERLYGRKLSVGLARLAIAGGGIDDPLFGFRVYPLAPLLAVLAARRTGRRYDFDNEAAVRLCWAGVRPVNVPAPVRYFSRAEGGVTHFRYGRDNVTLAWMHLRLVLGRLGGRGRAMREHRRRWAAESGAAEAGSGRSEAGTWPSAEPAGGGRR